MPSTFLAKHLVVLLALLAGGCRAGSGGGSRAADGQPLQLERLMVGSVYGVGSSFESDGLRFSVEAFGEAQGNAEIAAAEASAPSPGAKPKKDPSKGLHLAHATLRCEGRKVAVLEFDFVDGGGPVALEVAGERRDDEDFIALDGARLGGALIEVTQESSAGVRRGHVRISGTLEKLAIGGADLRLVDLRLSGSR